MDARIEQLLTLHAGAVRRKELLEAGIPLSVARHEIAAGGLIAGPRGVIALPGTAQQWVAARARGADVACISAAHRMGLGVVSLPDRLHAQVPRFPFAGPFTIHKAHDGGVLGVLRQCSTCLSKPEALVIVESAVTSKLVTLPQLRQAATGQRRTKFSDVVALVNSGSESVPETIARYTLEQAGYLVQVQAHIAGLGRLDLLVDGVLGIEIDGRAWHSDAASFAEDRRRNNAAVICGLPVLRFPYATVMHHSGEFLKQVAAALAVTGRG